MSLDRFSIENILDAINNVTVSGGGSTDLTDVESDLNTLVSSSASSLTKIDTVNTNLGTINTSLGTVNTTTANVSTNIGLINTRLDTVNSNLTNNVYGRYSGSIRTTDVVVSGSIASLVPVNNLSNRRDIIVMNTSSSTIYVGGSNVTRFSGIPVISGTVFSLPLGPAQLYAITPDTGTTVSGIRVLEVS